jgi:plastocyanin domain-containing protein
VSATQAHTNPNPSPDFHINLNLNLNIRCSVYGNFYSSVRFSVLSNRRQRNGRLSNWWQCQELWQLHIEELG